MEANNPVSEIKSLSSEAMFFTVSDRGLGQISKNEIFELTNSEAVSDDSVSIFKTQYKSAVELCYSAQSIKRCVLLFSKFPISLRLDETEESVKNALSGLNFDFVKGKPFVVECERIGAHEYSSVDLARAIASVIIAKTGAFVDFKSPLYIIYAYARDSDCHVGLDLSGFDLSKREYKVFNHPGAFKGTIAYAIFRSGFEASAKTGDISILNPFCRSGVISIEAALFFSRFPVNFFRRDSFAFLKFGFPEGDFDKVFKDADSKLEKRDYFRIFASDPEMRNIAYAKKNAKIAGVEKKILFSRNDLEWLDIRFGGGKIDLIVSDLSFGKFENAKKIMREFFNQADYLLETGGSICVACRDYEDLKSFAESYGFSIAEHLTFFQGQQQVDCYIIKRLPGKGKKPARG